MGVIKIKQEDSYDWNFESEEAWESYLEDIFEEHGEERMNKIISIRENQNE